MAREPIIVSPYDQYEISGGDGVRPHLQYTLSGPEIFTQRIENAYGRIAERGGKVVLEGLVRLTNQPADYRKYAGWGGPIAIEPSLLIIADFPSEPNPNLLSYTPEEQLSEIQLPNDTGDLGESGFAS